MTVLVGGLRVLGANAGRVQARRLHQKPETLTNDFFVNLLDMSTQWQPAGSDGVYEGRDRKTNAVKWTGTRVDLIFGSHSQLRAFAEVYGCADSKGEVREGLRGGVDQGDEPRSLRDRLISGPAVDGTDWKPMTNKGRPESRPFFAREPRSRAERAGLRRSIALRDLGSSSPCSTTPSR